MCVVELMTALEESFCNANGIDQDTASPEIMAEIDGKFSLIGAFTIDEFRAASIGGSERTSTSQ